MSFDGKGIKFVSQPYANLAILFCVVLIKNGICDIYHRFLPSDLVIYTCNTNSKNIYNNLNSRGTKNVLQSM